MEMSKLKPALLILALIIVLLSIESAVSDVTSSGATTNTQTTQAVQPTLTDPSQFAQAQVGAAVQQPTLPQGGAVLPNLALQSVTPNQLQTTPGLQGTVAAATTFSAGLKNSN